MSQTRYRWMIFIVLVLLISNIFLAFLLLKNNNPATNSKKNTTDKTPQWYSEVGLNEKQIDTFKILREEFFKEAKPIWQEIRQLKDSLYHTMEKPETDSSVISIIAKINEKNTMADLRLYRHFSRLRTMCTPDQQVRFDTIVPKMVNRPWRKK